MTAPPASFETKPSPEELPALPYAERVRQWLSTHDPGAIDATRAMQLGLSIVLLIFLGTATTRAFDLGLDVSFPLMAGAAALVLITFTPAASRKTEARTMARLFGLSMAFLLLLWAIGPGEGATNEVVQKLLLVPFSFLALLLRRYGMDGQRLGIALIIVATVGTILKPTRIDAFYFLIAFCQGAAVTAAIRLSPWRPSALRAFVKTALDMQDVIAAYLREMSEAVRTGRPFSPAAGQMVETARTRVWNALGNATAEDPGARMDFEHLRAMIYRLRVAAQLLASCIPEGDAEGPDWRGPFSAAADHIARRLEAIDVSDVQAEVRFERAVAQLKVVAFDPRLSPITRFALLRAVTAFDRLALVVTAIALSETMPFPPPHEEEADNELPAPPAPPPLVSRREGGGRTLSAPLKVACQGLVGTAITTGFDLAFSLDHAYWATMTVMFVMGNSVGETFQRVRYRTVGTLVGVAMGFGLFLALDGHVWTMAACCLLAQMVALVTQKDRYDVASAAVGLSVVLGLHLIAGLGADGMLARVYETIIGAGIALAVSYLVLPVYLTDQLRPEVRSIMRRCRDTFATWWPKTTERLPVGPLVRDVRALDQRLPQMGAEQMFGHSAGDVANIASTLDVLVTYLALMEDITQRLAHVAPKDEVVAAVEAARGRILSAFAQVLGEGGGDGAAAAAPAMEAAVSVALNMADDPAVKAVLPLVADYLAYSDALLRPVTELHVVLSEQAPWRRQAVFSGGTGKAPASHG